MINGLQQHRTHFRKCSWHSDLTGSQDDISYVWYIGSGKHNATLEQLISRWNVKYVAKPPQMIRVYKDTSCANSCETESLFFYKWLVTWWLIHFSSESHHKEIHISSYFELLFSILQNANSSQQINVVNHP